MSPRFSRVAVLPLALWLAASPAAAQTEPPTGTVAYLVRVLLGPVLDLLGRSVDAETPAVDPVAATGCDPLDAARCLLPFPNDYFTVPDATTDTGKRISFSHLATPRNVAGKPIDPSELNRNDGFSPGSMILTRVPGLDLETTGAPRLTDPAVSLSAASPIVVVNAETNELHPVWAELDENQGAKISFHDLADLFGFDPGDAGVEQNPIFETPPTQDHERLLIVRPSRNFEEGTRYVVAMRKLRDANDTVISAGPVFTAIRDALLPVDPVGRQRHYETAIAPVLEAAGVPTDDLYLAWDFTVASASNIAGRTLHIRDDAFATLAGNAPSFTVASVSAINLTHPLLDEDEDPETVPFRRVEGTFQVPNYLNLPGGQPGSTFNYVGSPDGEVPARNPLGDFVEANFICNVPNAALSGTPKPPLLYGHGLLGSAGEVNNSQHAMFMAERGGFVMCATDWDGMSGEDLPVVATILADASNFPRLADRAQQGFLNFMFLGRLMIHPDGFCADPAFRSAAGCLIDDNDRHVLYDGNSQGGIMGGSLVALAHDVRRGVLGVPGMNYSTLLNRSVDWENAFAFPFYVAYPDKMDQQIAFSLMQMLWDRAEMNGFAHHATTNPYPDPANDPFHQAGGDKQILLHVAWADHQVAVVAAEVEARTIGAGIIETSLWAPNHWETTPFFGLPALVTPTAPSDRKSAIVYWHNGNNPPPIGNVPPLEECRDPHESPRRDPRAVDQKAAFLKTGVIDDPCDGFQCQTTARRDCDVGNQPGAPFGRSP